jgi:dienelactone hydrolase
VIARAFYAWERRLASEDQNRLPRPFEWGLDWLNLDPASPDPSAAIAAWSSAVMRDTDAFYGEPRQSAFERSGDRLRFESAIRTPHPENNVVMLRVFPARERRPNQPRRAVVVLPQWNADAEGHVGLCRLFAWWGITALRLTLPYHETRRPADLARSEYIVSANVGRTLQVNRQAVVDTRRAVDWLQDQGYERIGVMGTSLGSCLSMLTMAHDPRIRAGAFNHVSPFFADVVWHGLSTSHVRETLEGHVGLDALREYWMPISPWPFIERVRGRRMLLVHARYDLTFPIDLSRKFLNEFTRRGVPHAQALLPCGHYTTGKTPFKYLDGYYLTKFFVDNL